MIKITEEWDEILKEEFNSKEYLALREFLKTEYSSHVVYPSMYDIFNSMKYTSFNDVKVVLLGQDPYHNEGQAMGLSFSVPDGVDVPPSLVNMYKELNAELGIPIRKSGNLVGWAKQGVLLLNAVLTVRAHQANSHKGKGWEFFTDSIIKKISDQKDHVVFLLWGGNARSKKPLIDKTKHLILECAHPSPLSAYNGFFGCGHFKKTNEYLLSHGKTPIDWSAL
ncbi:MAG: uracil-DNA glycosylase [Clostridiales bacterium]|nr:uracil-DNA glycosylase [Clostridiales bacterium]